MTDQFHPAVIVMTRVPSAGGKTRLRDAMSDNARVDLQEAFLRDTLALVTEADIGPVYVAYTPPAGRPSIEDACPTRIESFPQRGADLGARLLDAMRRVSARGRAPLLVVGTDTPLLQPEHLRSALKSLALADVCLGPSEDGGYYLLGVRTGASDLVRDIPWGTEHVLDTTIRRATEAGLRYHLLDTLYDVDTPEDVARARRDLRRLAGEGSFRLPRRTLEALLAGGIPAVLRRGER